MACVRNPSLFVFLQSNNKIHKFSKTLCGLRVVGVIMFHSKEPPCTFEACTIYDQ